MDNKGCCFLSGKMVLALEVPIGNCNNRRYEIDKP